MTTNISLHSWLILIQEYTKFAKIVNLVYRKCLKYFHLCASLKFIKRVLYVYSSSLSFFLFRPKKYLLAKIRYFLRFCLNARNIFIFAQVQNLSSGFYMCIVARSLNPTNTAPAIVLFCVGEADCSSGLGKLILCTNFHFR